MNKVKMNHKPVNLKINLDKEYSMCLTGKMRLTKTGKLYKIRQKTGNKIYLKKTKINCIKLTESKLTLIMCLVLISQALIPGGWKVTDNFKYNEKNKNQKNYKTKNPKNENYTLKEIGNPNDKFQRDGSHEINQKIWKELKSWAPSNKIRNKDVKSYNGNRKGNISVMHWNLGSKHWDKKRDEVQLLVDQLSPDLLFISEANLFSDTPAHLTEIEGYKMTKSKTMEGLNYSRILLLSREGLIFTTERDRMDRETSTIWIKIGSRGNRSLRQSDEV